MGMEEGLSMLINRNRLRETYVICPDCGNAQKIWRRMAKCKSVGHIKTIYCYVCKKETDHVEQPKFEYLQAAEGLAK